MELFSVKEIKKGLSAKASEEPVSIHGYLALRHGKVSMIQDDFDANDWLAIAEWLEKEHLEVQNEDLLYVLLDQLPKRSGGVSPFFDDCVITGALSYTKSGELSIRAETISIKPKYYETSIEIDLSERAVTRGKEVFEAYEAAIKLLV